jgi:hypothetical protein
MMMMAMGVQLSAAIRCTIVTVSAEFWFPKRSILVTDYLHPQ